MPSEQPRQSSHSVRLGKTRVAAESEQSSDSVEDFLKPFKSNKKDCTHVVTVEGKKEFVELSSHDDIVTLLNFASSDGLSISEKIPTDRSYSITLTLRQESPPKNRMWTATHLISLATDFVIQLKRALNVSNEQLSCMVMSIPSYYYCSESNMFTDQLHFVFPYFRVKEWIKNEQLNTYIEHALNNSDMFRKMTVETALEAITLSKERLHRLPIGAVSDDWNTVALFKVNDRRDRSNSVDSNSSRTSVSKQSTLELTSVKLTEFLPAKRPRLSKETWKGLLTSHYGIRIEDDGICWGAVLVDTNVGIVKNPKRTAKGNRKRNMAAVSMKANEDMAIAAKLVEMLSKKRAQVENWRILVGQILFDIGEGGETAMIHWDLFLSHWAEYVPEYTDEQWAKYTHKTYNINDLKILAQIDSPEKYTKWLDHRILSSMQLNIQGCDHDIATVIYEKYGPYFVASNLSKDQKNCWYYFDKHHWVPTKFGYRLRKYMSEQVYVLYIRLQQDLLEQLTLHHDDKNKMNTILEAIGSVKKIMNALKDTSKKDHIIRQCQELFYSENFEQTRDINPEMIAFPNGVLDMSTDQEFFRIGLPSDMLTKSMKLPFDKTMNLKSPEVKMWKKFIREVLYEDELIQYIQEKGARLLVGFNEQKEIDLWSGKYNNAKSTLLMLLKAAFGEYMIMIPFTIFTKGQQNGLCPELQRAGAGVRIVAAEEGNGEEEKFNAGIVKQMSGNTEYYARALFQDGYDIKPMFKIIMTINEDMPRAPAGDVAFFSRFRLVPFNTDFVFLKDDLAKTYSEQLTARRLPVDPKFRSKMNDIAKGMLWCFVEEFRYARHQATAKLPASILAATKGYRSDNDSIAQFIDEKIVANKGEKMYVSDFATIYYTWYEEVFNKKNLTTNRNKITKYLCGIWNRPSTDDAGIYWKGYSWRGGSTVQDQESYGA